MMSCSKASGAASEASKASSKKAIAHWKQKGTRYDREEMQAMDKVRGHVEFKDFGENQAYEKAKELTDPDGLKDYFSFLLEKKYEEAAGKTRRESDLKPEFTNSREEDEACDRASDKLKGLCRLPIKLELCKLTASVPAGFVVTSFASLLDLKYGPTHAAVIVGDGDETVVLEWDYSSLVVPHNNTSELRLMKIGYRSPLSEETHKKLRVPVVDAAKVLDYTKQYDLLFEAAVEKSKLIDNLIEVIIKYNKLYHYHPFTRNCQTFVLDAMEALGIKSPYNFPGRLGEYFNQLKQGKRKSIPGSIDSHADLDAKVMRSIDQLSKTDIEYYLAVYFGFHLASREQSPDPKNWVCPERACQMHVLDEKVDRGDLLASQLPQAAAL